VKNMNRLWMSVAVILLGLSGAAFHPPQSCTCVDYGLYQAVLNCSNNRMITSSLTCTPQTVGLPCIISGSLSATLGATGGCIDRATLYGDWSCAMGTASYACDASSPIAWTATHDPVCPSSGSCLWVAHISFQDNSTCAGGSNADYLHLFGCQP
jgi:hypothetical protein